MKRIPILFLLAALTLFAAGLAHLFKLRFEAGDIYPEYSSLRADPLGAKALYESLGELIATRRNHQPFARLNPEQPAALFYLGSDADELRFTPEEFKGLEAFVVDGGRLVISFFPAYQRTSTNRPVTVAAPAVGGSQTNVPPTRRTPGPGGFPALDDPRTVWLSERWGLEFGHDPLQKDERGTYQPALAFLTHSNALPGVLSSHTGMVFDRLDQAWRVIYARTNHQPILIERDYGEGTIVLCADSYYFSNEALRKEPQPQLLAWLAGSSRSVVFDETHLGVTESPGLASLARKYHLHSLGVALMMLAALFVWKNSTSFMPPYEEEWKRERGDLVAGKESAAGFVNLLRRNIAPPELLGVCLQEWQKSCARGVPRARLEQIQSVIDSENQRPAKERNPVATYQSISRILKRKI